MLVVVRNYLSDIKLSGKITAKKLFVLAAGRLFSIKEMGNTAGLIFRRLKVDKEKIPRFYNSNHYINIGSLGIK